MKVALLFVLLFSSITGLAQYDTLNVSTDQTKLTLQRYHLQHMRDTIVLHNDLNVGVMLANVQVNSKGHEARVGPTNYIRPGQYGFLILTATPRNLVQPYHMEYHLTFFSDAGSAASHSMTLKVTVDYNS